MRYDGHFTSQLPGMHGPRTTRSAAGVFALDGPRKQKRIWKKEDHLLRNLARHDLRGQLAQLALGSLGANELWNEDLELIAQIWRSCKLVDF